jgi:RNA polymerase sigma-70 factor (ECF subfamily)
VYAGNDRPCEARLKELLPHLRRYARGLVPSREAADALVEATLARAAGPLDAFGAERESRVRLFSVMHEVYMESTGGAAAGPSSPGNPTVAQFDRALGYLPPPQREVFLLVTLEELSYEEVAKTLGVPIGTVMSRLSRAREKLRAVLRTDAAVRAVK